jgi:hypothetical protein
MDHNRRTLEHLAINRLLGGWNQTSRRRDMHFDQFGGDLGTNQRAHYELGGYRLGGGRGL